MKYKYRYQEWYKDVKIDCKAHSHKELMQKVRTKKEQIDKQTIDADMKLDDFCQLYLDTYKRDSVSDSWYEVLCFIKDKLVSYIGNKPVGKIKPIEVQSFLNSCNTLSDSTIKKIYIFTRQIFDEMQTNGATQYRFVLTAPNGKPKATGRSLSVEEQNALLNVIKGHRGELFISIMYYCGLRPSEVSALRWEDIDLEKNIVRVSKAVKRDGSIGSPKSIAGVREVPIPMALASMITPQAPIEYVCRQRNGHHTKGSVRRMWSDIKTKVSDELGEPFDARLYDIRHTYCTNLEKAGVPINIASRLMGHSNISITSKIYTHASDEALEIARRCIDGVSS